MYDISPMKKHEDLLREIKDLISAEFPIVAKNGRTLRVSGIRWDDFGTHVMNNISAQKDAKLKEKSINSNLVGDVELIEEDGSVVDSKRGYILLTMPHVTARNSYLIEGNEVQIINQLRLRPGLYTNFKGDNEIETYLNTSAAGTYKVLLDRKTGIIRFKVGSDKKVPIYSVLLALGATPSRIDELLGSVAEINKKAANVEKDTEKLLTSLWPYAKVGSTLENQQLIKDFLASKPSDPEVNMLTVGKPIDKIDLMAVEASVTKCLALSKGTDDEDDRESLAYKSIHSIEDFIPEKIRRKAPTLRRMIQYQMTKKDSIPAIMPSTFYGNIIKDFMTTSEFSRYSDQNNPIDMNAIASTTTILGEGGISSTMAVKDEVRTIHPSHFGVLDTLHSPEGDKVGITSHLSLGAKKKGNKLYLLVFDAKTGRPEEISVDALMPKTVAFPDQYENVGKGKPKLKAKVTKVKVRRGTKMLEVMPSEVEYIFNDSASFFSTSTSVVPFLNSNSANRVLMADKHIEQSVQLADPDKPLVQHRLGGAGKGYLEIFGENFLVKSPVDGTIKQIKKDAIVITSAKGEDVSVDIHHNYPLNSKTFLHDTPIVSKGDKVKAGQPLVENNFTKEKTLALGKNLSVAFIPYKGYNFEDGTVISHKAAQKLASVHKEEYRVEKEENVVVGLNEYIAQFPQNLEKLGEGYKSRYDTKGVIKVGEKVKKNDILIPAVREVKLRKTEIASLHKKILTAAPHDISQVWDKDVEGEVVDVVHDRNFVKVIVKSVEPAVVGDKLSAFAGAKGIITKILSPEETYKDENGKEIDILFNGFGNVGRVNPGFLLEAGAGKVAQKTGKTFYVDNFNMTHDSNLKHVQDALKAAGVNDEETITNEATGHTIPRVLVGPIHTLKLKHKVSGKFSARGAGAGSKYTTLEQPKKESGESAQRIAPLDMFSLLSGDAMAFLDDAYGVKSQKNDDYWLALQTGRTLPPPRTPFVAEKFAAMLIASGINLEQDGNTIKALPMTDKEILRISHGEISNPGTLKSPTLKAQKSGLFDETITGGVGGSKFSHIELAHPIVNPLMREAVVSVGDFASGVELDDIILGKKSIAEDGSVIEGDSGATGIEAIIARLDSIDVDKAIKQTAEVAKKSKATALNKAHRRLRYLKVLKKLDMKASEAYINKYVPVLPPKFRQITEMPDGSVSVADANHGYRELIMINNQIKELKDLGIDKEHMEELVKALQDSATASVGLGAFVTKGREFRGLIEEINGVKESKHGFFKSKLQSRPQDLSARTTIIPNPKLNLDEAGIPKKMAMTIYGPFVIRKLVQSGYSPLQARDMVKDQTDEALSALQTEVEDRPILMSRAPSLHKFNMLSFKPKLIDGKAVEVNPLIVAGYNADFDGDTMGIHVPVSEEARQEAAEKLLPSRNLISPRDDFVMHTPSKETVLGIYLLTTPKGDPIKVKDMADARKMLAAKKIRENTAIKINDTTHCIGQKMVNDVFPANYKPGLVSINGKQLDSLFLEIARNEKPEVASGVLNRIKDLGNHYVTELGYAVSLKDLEFDYKKRDAILDRMDRKAKIVGFDKAVGDATEELEALLAMATDNRFVEATFTSKATGKGGAVRQMVATPIAVTDSKGNLIPFTIRKSYAEGHDLGSYLGTTPGSRQGLIDKGISVAQTGYLNRLLVNANIANKISMTDCKTTEGIAMPIDSSEAVFRFGAEGTYRNTALTPDKLRELKRNGLKEVVVRSPLKCKAHKGICAKCAGLNEQGKEYNIGFHIGSQAAQSVGERATQVTLQKFHSGGAAGGASLGFGRLKQLFNLPQTIKNKAVLAEETGPVRIEPSSTGGWFVHINRSKHYVPQELGIKVKEGESVVAGQQLSQHGVIKPQDLLEATGNIDLVRDKIIDELAASYGKQRINRRTFETVVKPMTDKAKISNPGDADKVYNVHAGDVLLSNVIEDYNKKLKARNLRPIVSEPILLGIPQIPHYSEDFVGQLTHERLKDTMKSAPALGKQTDLMSGHSVSKLVMKNFPHIEDVKNAPRFPFRS